MSVQPELKASIIDELQEDLRPLNGRGGAFDSYLAPQWLSAQTPPNRFFGSCFGLISHGPDYVCPVEVKGSVKGESQFYKRLSQREGGRQCVGFFFLQGTEMMQNLQLYRGKKGMDTMFDHNEDGKVLTYLKCLHFHLIHVSSKALASPHIPKKLS